MKSGVRPVWKDVAYQGTTYKDYWSQWDSLEVRDGLLVQLWESMDGMTTTEQLVLLESKQPEVLKELYEGTSGGHFGDIKMLDKLRKCYYWLQMRANVERWCKYCDLYLPVEIF